jgi:hypothetical protein
MSRICRSTINAFAAVIFMLYGAFALAAPQAWNEAAFHAAQAAGKPILVDVFADW